MLARAATGAICTAAIPPSAASTFAASRIAAWRAASLRTTLSVRRYGIEQASHDSPPKAIDRSALLAQRLLADGGERGRGRDRLRVDLEVQDRGLAGFPRRLKRLREI